MLTLELDQHIEASLLEIARREHLTPAQIIQQLLSEYLAARKSSELLINIANAMPPVEAFLAKNPLQIQQEIRDEWR